MTEVFPLAAISTTMEIQNYLKTLINLLVLFGGFFSWILALGQLTGQMGGKLKFLSTFSFFLVGLWQISAGIRYSGIAGTSGSSFPVFMISIFYFSVPFIYFYFRIILTPGFKIHRFHAVHFIPAIVSVLFLLPVRAGNIDLYKVMNIFYTCGCGDEIILSAVMYSAMIFFFFYLTVLFPSIVKILRNSTEESKKTIKLTISLFIYLMIFTFAWFADRLFSLQITQYVYLSVTLFLILIFLISMRYPEFLLILKLEAEHSASGASQIEKLDIEFYLIRLNELMTKDKLYKNETISLQSLAEIVGITHHQLSEILNKRLNKNFFNFINEFRIEEAKRLLLDEPDRTVLSIAYEIGFNSLSAFYNIFKKHTDLSPTGFRKKTK